MSLDSKVVWTEGMFLNPQHFQQQERYFERLVEDKVTAYGAYGWGLKELEIDQQLLKLGKLSIIRAKGVFSDGTPFNVPELDDVPPVIDIPPNVHNAIAYLAIPVRRPGAIDVLAERDSQGLARYYTADQSIRDVTVEGGDSIGISVGKLRLRLLLETEDLSGYVAVGLVRIAESREDKNVLLDDQYIPTVLDCAASPKLIGFLSELVGLLHHRGESIASRLADTKRGGTAEIADYMLLQLVNRIEPMAVHMSQMQGLHPVTLYSELVQMVGEISTFVTKNKRPPAISPYLHDNLQASFMPAMSALRQCLTMVYEQTAIAMPLQDKKYGIRVAQLPDRSLIGTAIFVLAVRANIPENTLRGSFPAQVKIGPVERIRQLVNAAMQGIPIRALPVVPRQIPYHSGYCYFELERQNEFWKELSSSGGIAFHIGGEFPGLEMEFWAVRQ